MKKTVLLMLAFAGVYSASAQYVITANRAPKAGDSFTTITDTIPQVSKGASGANATWNLSDFDYDVIGDPTTFEDASTVDGFGSFPESELAINGGGAGGGSIFFNLNANKLEWIGLILDVGNGPEPVRLKNPETYQQYPSAFGSAYKDTGEYRFSFFVGQDFGGAKIDSARITYYNFKDVTYDGFGSLTTPFATYANALRERAYTITEQKVEFCIAFVPGFPCTYVDGNTLAPGISEPRDTSVVYNWYSDASTSPLATISYNKDDATIRTADVQDLSNGINDYKLSSSLVYPNPAKETIFIKEVGAAQNLNITDLFGRNVLSVNNLNGNDKIDISSLANGTYVVTIQTATGLSTQKLVKN